MSPAVAEPRAPRPADRGGGWRASAFGLDLEGEFPAPGLAGCAANGHLRRTVLELVDGGEIEAGWPRSRVLRVSERRLPGGRLLMSIDRHDELGYRVSAPGHGRYRIAADGTSIRCAPPRVAPWRWQRLLIGQAVPFASVLQGLEVFHASAVSLGDRAVAFVGNSQAGKSSVAINLVHRGAGFVCDDVLALEPRGDTVAAHPGAGIASVRFPTARLLGPAGMRALGTAVGRDREGVRVTIPREERPLALAALYFLERGAATRSLTFEPVSPPDPRALLAASFNFVVATPERLTGLLEVCSRIACGVPVFRARAPEGVGPAALAEAIEAHAPV